MIPLLKFFFSGKTGNLRRRLADRTRAHRDHDVAVLRNGAHACGHILNIDDHGFVIPLRGDRPRKMFVDLL